MSKLLKKQNILLIIVLATLILFIVIFVGRVDNTPENNTETAYTSGNDVENVSEPYEEQARNEEIMEQDTEEQEGLDQERLENENMEQEDPEQEEIDNEQEEVLFEEVNEQVYAMSDVNIRQEPNITGDKVGLLRQGKEITRTGIGSNGWDRVLYNGDVAYINHNYLSTEEIVAAAYVTASLDSADQYPEGWLESFNQIIIQLQEEFPKGMYWNHMGSTENGNGVTDTPCNHKTNGETYCNSYHGNSDDAYDTRMTSVQCLGFASMLSDRIFGTDAEAIRFTDYDDIRIGDQARINNGTHTVLIIDKTDEYVIVAECNADYKTCIINWGRRIPRDQMSGWYISRGSLV